MKNINKKKNTQQKTVYFNGGGDSRDRTGDLLNAIKALYQLSYTPKDLVLWHFIIFVYTFQLIAGGF